MHWRTPHKRYINDNVVHDIRRIHSAKGTTQLVSLENHRKPKRANYLNLCQNIILYCLAAYGLYRLVIEPVLYYAVTPNLNRMWKWVL